MSNDPFATIAGIINWGIIMITQLHFRQAVRRGDGPNKLAGRTGDEAIASLRFPLPFARVTPWVVLVFLLLVVVLMCFSPNYVVAAIAGPVWIVVLLLGYAATARHAR